MYLIIKTIQGYNYYWNEVYQKWEGLSDNGTALTSDRLDYWMRIFLNQFDGPDHTFIKI